MRLPGAGGGEADEPMVLRSWRDRLKQQGAAGLLGRNEFEDLRFNFNAQQSNMYTSQHFDVIKDVSN
uniref:Uncharacterized protein n=1 Tax=Oryza meridionalis TaxID=40149 RepID=A0A0E0C8M0_9ORYZ